MEFKNAGERWLIRLEKGEEIISSLLQFSKENNVFSASIMGIGATDRVSLSIFDSSLNRYIEKEYKGDYEISSLMGNISLFEGEPALHIHITLGDRENKALAGHLNYAYISGTCEIFVDQFSAPLERKLDKESGLKLLSLKD